MIWNIQKVMPVIVAFLGIEKEAEKKKEEGDEEGKNSKKRSHSDDETLPKLLVRQT